MVEQEQSNGWSADALYRDVSSPGYLIQDLQAPATPGNVTLNLKHQATFLLEMNSLW
jgi:hypothetical protein